MWKQIWKVWQEKLLAVSHYSQGNEDIIKPLSSLWEELTEDVLKIINNTPGNIVIAYYWFFVYIYVDTDVLTEEKLAWFANNK